MHSSKISGYVYLTVRPDFRNPSKLAPVKATSRYPSVVDADCAVIRVYVTVPYSAFTALEGGAVEVAEPPVAEVTA